MKETVYECSTCGCLFYSSDGVKLNNGYRELFCYTKGYAEYARKVKKQRNKEFFRLLTHYFFFLMAIILAISNAISPNPEYVNSANGAILMGFIVLIISAAITTVKKDDYQEVGSPYYEIEKTTTYEYSDGSKKEEKETSSAYSLNQYKKIGNNLGIFICMFLAIGFLGWLYYISYYINYRKNLSLYFSLKKKIRAIKKDKYQYSAVKLCDKRNVNKRLNLSIMDENGNLIEDTFVLLKVLNIDGTIYSLVKRNNQEEYIKILPGRKALLVDNIDSTNGNEDDEENDETPNAIDMLLDENCSDNIILLNEKEEPIEFQQVATIPLNDVVYAILKPIEEIEGVSEDEAFVFNVDVENEKIMLVEDEGIIDKVFDEYNKLLGE